MAPARPLTREGAEAPYDRDQGRRLTAFILAAASAVRGRGAGRLGGEAGQVMTTGIRNRVTGAGGVTPGAYRRPSAADHAPVRAAAIQGALQARCHDKPLLALANPGLCVFGLVQHERKETGMHAPSDRRRQRPPHPGCSSRVTPSPHRTAGRRRGLFLLHGLLQRQKRKGPLPAGKGP